MKLNKIIVAAALLAVTLPAPAQVSLSGLPHAQNFNTLGTASAAWTDNSTLLGWYAANNNAGTVTAYTGSTVGSGGGTSSSVLYNLGTSSDTDRALGGAPASARYSILGLRLLNDTGSVFNDVSVQFDLEQWSDRGTATITMSYQTFGAGLGSLNTLTGWTTLTSTSSPLPTNLTPVSGIGNTTGLIAGITGGISALGLPAGDELWVRWEITKIGGANSTHGIDNVVVAVPEPTTAALAGIGLLLVCNRVRSRRKA
jgi:serralysin